jgi:hypothetical protein
MKYIFLVVFILIANFSFGQSLIEKIDTSNYYDYYHSQTNDLKSSNLTTSWLTKDEITPVIMEEIKNKGFDWLSDNQLFKIDSGQYVVLSAYSEKSNFGFLYIETHYMLPEKKHRNNLTERDETGSDYVSHEETVSGESNFVHINKLPKNIFLLNQNCYWYQYTDSLEDNNALITKEIAFKILRQDIDTYLSKVKVNQN